MATSNVNELNFSKRKTVLLEDRLSVPVPDGYHYGINGEGGNADWLYIVPENVSLDEDHINAKPVGFGISAKPVTKLTFTVDRIDALKQVFVNQGWLDEYISIDEHLCSDHCAFVYQKFTDETDLTYSKMRGFALDGENVYLIHVFANYDEAIADEFDTRLDFINLIHSWLGEFFVEGDTDTAFENDDECDGEFSCETPDEELYPHYKNLKSASGKFGGINVVANSGGTEYSFISFRKALENTDDEDSADMSALYKRVIEKNTQSYNLYQKAKEMQKLFRVSETVFDSKHDRECELEEGLMHRAYMMSALRSFTWTIADYCEEQGCAPKDISYEVASRVVGFVSDREWLNYDGDTYCTGLCSGSDLHVFYVPDSVSKADRKKLLPTKEDYDRVERMKEQFPSYNEILTEVHSLDALRNDLEYIYPAVKTLFNQLAKERDYDEPLLGGEADIVYAWCALALAAKEPFFTEDGPMNCWFSQIDHSYDDGCEYDEDDDYGNYSFFDECDDEDDEDLFENATDENNFVIDSHSIKKYIGQEKDVVIPGEISSIWMNAFEGCELLRSVKMKFKECFSWEHNFNSIDYGAFRDCKNLEEVYISGELAEIDYSSFYGCSSLKRIILPDTVKSIGNDAFCGCISLEYLYIPSGAKEIGPDILKGTTAFICSDTDDCYAKEYADKNGIVFKIRDSKGKFKTIKSNWMRAEYSPKRKVSSKKTFVIENGVLLKYNGSGNAPKIPAEVTVIGEGAFANNKKVKDIVIRDGVTKIEDFAFYDCENVRITISPTVREIGENVITAKSECDMIYAVKDSYAYNFFENYKIPFYVMRVDEEETRQKETLSVGTEIIEKNGFIIKGNVLIGYEGSEEDITIPDNVTEIADSAFEDCEPIINVVIPGNVKKIGSKAFYWSSIHNITLCNGIKEIGELAFGLCNGLSVIEFPESVEYIGEDVMEDCQELEKIIIHNKSAVIGESAFSGCISAVNEKGFLIIDNRLFRYMDNVTNDEVVNIPDGVRKIDGYAFVGAEIAKTYVLPQSVETISGSAFEYCDGIENIEISNNNVDIHPDAFKGIENLTVFAHEGSNAEKFAKENGYKFEMVLTDEQKAAIKLAEEKTRREAEERRRREAEERRIAEEKRVAEEKRIAAQRKSEYEALVAEKEQLLQTIAENKGLFGEKARRRKEAKAKLAEVEAKMNNYPEYNQ